MSETILTILALTTAISVIVVTGVLIAVAVTYIIDWRDRRNDDE